MHHIRFQDGGFVVDAAIIAKGLKLAPDRVWKELQAGTITSLCERGAGEDMGTFRLSFFTGHSHLRVIVNGAGEIIRQSALHSSDHPSSATAR